MKRLLTTATLLLLGLFSRSALAWECKTLISSITVTPPSMTVPRDLPVGSPIGNPVNAPPINAFVCENTDVGDINNQILGPRGMGTFESMLNGRRIYKTNIDGIGYSISASTTHCDGASAIVTGSNTIKGQIDTANMCETTNGMISAIIRATMTVTFYKTATTTGSGTVTGRNVGTLAMLNNSVLWQNPEPLFNINPFTVTTTACKVLSSNIRVRMKEVKKNAFSGKDSTPGDAFTQSFALPMSCDAGTPVNVRLEGDVYDATKGVFNIASGPDAATGVGIQLLHDNQPLALNTDVPVGTSQGGSFTVPLQARYYQTGNSVTPGMANGMVSFTMTYQ
ncbi:fimbrial protein [Enterobacteriaceae bacterium 89]|nr:fimbrial protein [Enterobacteriaceae bacterium 89]